MGVPKFFRWLSERYPAISMLIAESRIPEFDSLYLDMNGIIHNCTHKDSDSPTFRMTEEQMFIAIFNYIEHLFGKIKPKKLFFMAVDGVAPRAKMNQQRARRFRTALDAEVAREKAIQQGLEMPKEDPFDSNCITPGTEFMAKLTQQLKYFINKKISEDSDWQGVEIVLSGHEVPGEGEHKIMEYIRRAKAQPDYHPNVRHCLYGLDADLIMLGLLSHDPHFCLLREEVTFGRQVQKKPKELEHQNFFLLHLSMVREYLELEFQELEQEGALNFPFDMERVIDDFILMAFFVGNDFLPNLPNLHINEGALALMFKIYKDVLRKMGGYINEQGVINVDRLGILVEALSEVEHRFFQAENSDAQWIKSKQNGYDGSLELKQKTKELTITSAQKDILKKVKKYVQNPPGTASDPKPLDFPPTLPARDRTFLEQLANELRLQWSTVDNEAGDRFMRLQLPQAEGDDDNDDDDYEDEEASMAVQRIIRKYERAKVQDMTAEEAQQAAEQQYDAKFLEWKDNYYRSKFGWGLDNEEEMKQLTENYVQGLQWVLFYYYRGIASWPWFFRYHYAPMISDVKKGLGADMNFRLGQPFRPYEQLMGVLPDRSKKTVPRAYWDLMTSPDSPIIDFYPRDFELDMNGKKMEWEAVVKIPFIDEKRLLTALKTKEKFLSPDEKARNGFGVSLKFTYSPEVNFVYPSSMPGVFPDLPNCHCIENIFDLPTMDGLEPYNGLMEGVHLGEAALAGFPSIKTLPHVGQLGFHGVTVFQQESRNESQIVTLLDPGSRSGIELAKQKLGKRVHVGYPFLQEALVIRVSDELFDYILPPGEPHIVQIPHTPQQIEQFRKNANKIEGYYSKRLGMIIGGVESLVHIQPLKGMIKTDEGAIMKYFTDIPGQETDYALQVVVDDVLNPDERFIEKEALPIEEEFPEGSRAFFLGDFNYGRPVHVTGHTDGKVNGLLAAVKDRESEFGKARVRQSEQHCPYMASYAIARSLNLNPLVLAKITSSFSVDIDGTRVNLGLNLKFEARKQKVLGYSRRGQSGWEFSQKAVDLLHQYMINFPEFIAGIQRNPQKDRYAPTDFYPEETALLKMKEIRDWLKSIEAKNFERVPLDAEQLDSDIVELIEQDADKLGQPQMQAKKVRSVPRSALLRPADVEHRLGNQTFRLGDRVVYAQDSGKVPIATRGTVVGLTRTSRALLLDVVFDVSFMSGTTLGGRCSPFRGQTVLASSVLNVSFRQLIAVSRAANNQQSQQQPTPLTVVGYGAPLGPNGQGQLKNASAPPPLRGSFKGAVAGHGASRGGHVSMNNGHPKALPHRPHPNNGPPRGPRGNGNRGRGGQHDRGGYTSVDNSDPSEGIVQNNPNFRPQNMSQMPPPQGLDRGRGRGRGRGNGYRGRGRGGRGGAPVTSQ
ncbi:5'-3' exoribonuclease [Penicillium canariense]|uniref:5'-3' exoribonuclease 1 n=1 Tax=Penicillium canariense TaxID=189055 RepID=A0A9W9IHK5_9EURO|nr:5'-3' exoribonuclease [Penicillium canariense]KAJ5176863.1 5'-3' exoribonuclease [Penicillium canariense]